MGEKELASDEMTARHVALGDASGREAASGMATGKASSGGGVRDPSPATFAVGGKSMDDDWSAQRESGHLGDGTAPEPAGGAVVKSKSNITNNREMSDGGGGGKGDEIAIGDPGVNGEAPDPAGLAIGDPGVNGNLTGDASPEPAEASNLNASKSNVDRAGAPVPPPSEASNLNLSKSNINREATGIPSPTEIAVTDEGVGPANPLSSH